MLFLPPFILVVLVIVIICDIFVETGSAICLAFGIAAMFHLNVWSCLLLQLLQRSTLWVSIVRFILGGLGCFVLDLNCVLFSCCMYHIKTSAMCLYHLLMWGCLGFHLHIVVVDGVWYILFEMLFLGDCLKFGVAIPADSRCERSVFKIPSAKL